MAVSTAPSGGSSASSSRGSASGNSANRAQDGVSRRDRGLLAMAERLRRKALKAKKHADTNLEQVELLGSPAQDILLDAPDRPFDLVVDVSGGITNIERSATALEGNYNADSFVSNLGGALVTRTGFTEHDRFLIGAGLAFEYTKSKVAQSQATGQSDFKNNSVTGNLFAGWTAPPLKLGFHAPAELVLNLNQSFGKGDQTYARQFSATYLPVVGGDTVTVNDALNGKVQQSSRSTSFQVSLAQPIGAFTLIPSASINNVAFKTGGYDEVNSDASDNGLALRYAAVEDHWVEKRAGLALQYTVNVPDRFAVQFTAGIDNVHIDGAETPVHTAYFVQDLRSDPVPIRYRVDNLDPNYRELNFRIALALNSGAQGFISTTTRLDHAYIKADSVSVGLRMYF